MLELPPYRLPTLRQIALRAWHEVRHFLRRATKFIVGGVDPDLAAHATCRRARAGRRRHVRRACSARLFQPVLSPLGIDEQLTVALIFGFVAKEVLIGAFAVIYGLEGQALAADLARPHGLGAGVQLHAVHADLHAVPVDGRHAARRGAEHCASRVASVAWSVALAWVASFAFYQAARHLGF